MWTKRKNKIVEVSLIEQKDHIVLVQDDQGIFLVRKDELFSSKESITNNEIEYTSSSHYQVFAKKKIAGIEISVKLNPSEKELLENNSEKFQEIVSNKIVGTQLAWDNDNILFYSQGHESGYMSFWFELPNVIESKMDTSNLSSKNLFLELIKIIEKE